MESFGLDYGQCDSGIMIEKYRGSDLVVDIPPKISGAPVTRLGEGSFANCATLREVFLPDTLLEFNAWAFVGCTALEKIHWRGSLIKLGGNEIKISADAKEIQLPSFFLHHGDPQVEETPPVPSKKITETPAKDFAYCFADSGIMIEKYRGSDSVVFVPPQINCMTVVRIGSNAFAGCRNVTEIHLPDTLTSVNSRAFAGCLNLKTVWLPRSCKAFNSVVAAVPEGCVVG